jgi:hypothetical protein
MKTAPNSNSPLMKQWPNARSKNCSKRPLKLATKTRSGFEMMNTRLLLVFAFTFATTNSVLADDIQDVKTSIAFLSSPGSSSINCKKMKRLMQAAEKSDRMARIAVACSDDVKESGSGPDAMRLPIGVALSSCAATNWKSEFCQGLKILAGN